MTETSIVIVTYGEWAFTEKCLQSLVAALGSKLGDTWEIVVVDNNSPDETAARLAEWSDRVRVEPLKENRNFAGGCNRGAELASGETLIFLNNDTEVPEHALETLVEQVREPGVAAAGCRLLFPNGRVQHAGVAFVSGLAYGGVPFAQHVFMHSDGDLAVTQGCFEADCVTAACLVVAADSFRAVGGFDERYRNGLEDVDLCLKLRTAGGKIIYRGDVTLIHHEGASRGRGEALLDSSDKKSASRANDALFVSGWCRQLDQDDALAAHVWDGYLQFQPPERGDGPAALTPFGVWGQPSGFGPAADESRALLRKVSLMGLRPAAYDRPVPILRPRVSSELRALVDYSLTLSATVTSPIVYIPSGPHDDLGGAPLVDLGIVRLARAQTVVPVETARLIWATTAAVRDRLVEDGLSTDAIRIVPPVVPEAAPGVGGAGILVVLPTHAPAFASQVLKALSTIPRTTPIRVLPTVYLRGWELGCREALPNAEPLPPWADEERFTAAAAEADVVLACDPSDHFDRRALVAASVGTTPLTLNPDGPAAAVLGSRVACSVEGLTETLRERLDQPLDREMLISAVRGCADPLTAALHESLTLAQTV